MEEFQSLLPEGKVVECLEDLGSLTVAELKSILKRYKEKTSGVKADLVLRTFAVFCRAKTFSVHSEDFLDESSLLCHEKEYTYEAFHQQCQHLPWTSDLRGTPAFNFLQLYEYLVIRTSKFKHILLKSTSYKKLKAFQFFYEGFIKKIDVATDNNFSYFDVRVKASMKKCLYKVILKLSINSGDVCSAACTCPAGIGLGGFGNCNHVGGVLFALEDFNRRGLREYPSAVSCTSKLSSWNVPNATALKSINPSPIDEVIIQKIKFGKDNDKSNLSRYKSFDPRAPSDKAIDDKRLKALKTKLAEALPNSGFFGFHEISEPADIALTEAAASSPEHPFFYESISFNEYYDISTSSFKEMMDSYCQNTTLSKEEISNIEKTTHGQASNDDWKKHRMYRITASNFYSAAVNSVEPSSKLNSMFYKSFTSAATCHGQKHEAHVKELYIMLLKDKGWSAIVFLISLSWCFIRWCSHLQK